MVRPERVEVAATPAGRATAPTCSRRGSRTLTFRGAHTAVLLDCADLRLEAEVANVAGAPPEWLCRGRRRRRAGLAARAAGPVD